MIAVRRSEQRRHTLWGRRETWSSFAPEAPSEPADPLHDRVAQLDALEETQLAPSASLRGRCTRPSEFLTYLVTGVLSYQDSIGRVALLRAGEFQCVGAERGLTYRETNAARSDPVRLFTVRLRSVQVRLRPNHAQARFSAAQRRGFLCAVATPDARHGSLRVQQDVSIYSALLDPGQHVVHELVPARSAWLHVVSGSVRLATSVLNAGDGAGISKERAVSVTAQQSAELLLFDLMES